MNNNLFSILIQCNIFIGMNTAHAILFSILISSVSSDICDALGECTEQWRQTVIYIGGALNNKFHILYIIGGAKSNFI